MLSKTKLQKLVEAVMVIGTDHLTEYELEQGAKQLREVAGRLESTLQERKVRRG